MKTRFLILVGILLTSMSASAQVYKCKVNGKDVYQGEPCQGNGSEIKIKTNSGLDRKALIKQMDESAKKQSELARRINYERSKNPKNEALLEDLGKQWNAEEKKFRNAQNALPKE